MSTFNLCVQDETNMRSYMYIWHEGIASRGPQEIASCLFFHFDKFIPENCCEIILYSDSCGAQNRNIKMSLMMSHYLDKKNNLKSITQSFFLSGHSYNVCDRKFAIIEKKRRQTTNIYTSTQWKELIEEAKVTIPKFIVTEMSVEHFVSCEVLKAVSTNRKKTTSKECLNWFTFHTITFKKGHPFELFFETYGNLENKFDESIEQQQDYRKTIAINKRGAAVKNFGAIELPLLYPNGRNISTDKKKDLLDLLEFVPLEYPSFYTNLNHGFSIRVNEYDEHMTKKNEQCSLNTA